MSETRTDLRHVRSKKPRVGTPTDPLACCILLTDDRQDLTDRAVKCFLAQTYEHRELLIYDTGTMPYGLPAVDSEDIAVIRPTGDLRGKVGALRNRAIEYAAGADIIAHWDSDDWSAPERIADQVSSLQMHTRYRAVGYHNILFLDSRDGRMNAWEYDYRDGNKALGASLVYWRRTWERQPFNENRTSGEDTEWHKIVPTRGLNGVCEPMLIAEVHGANTSTVYTVFDNHVKHHQPEWRRAPEFDSYCVGKLYPQASAVRA